MRNFTIITALLAAYCTYAQTDEQVTAITSKYDKAAIASLKAELDMVESERNHRIEMFLEVNPSVPRVYTGKNGASYEIYDIIDNKAVYKGTDNASAAIASGAASMNTGGSLGLNLDGQGMFVGVWDGGYARKSHVQFLNDATPAVSRVSFPDTPNPNPTSSFHPTHVAGTVGANGTGNASAKGMAPKVLIKSFNWTSDENEVLAQATNFGMLISNHSYGVPLVNDATPPVLNVPVWFPGCYNSDARRWDNMLYNLPYYLEVTSAGNHGSDSYTGGFQSGFDKLTAEKNAKNNLVVANANPNVSPVSQTVTSFSINGSSSQGPSDDGRIKPDIAADGTLLLSTVETSDTATGVASGTSMATPSTSGTLILLQQHYNNLNSAFMRAATLKALVCHTAKDDVLKVGPDAKFGWGLLDGKKATQVITESSAALPTAIIKELTLEQGQTYTIQVSATGTSKLEATICWTDVPGVAQDNQVNSLVPALVNDLDLRIKQTLPSAVEYFPWKLQMSNVNAAAIKGDNVVDNVEKVEVDNPSSVYTIEVSHKGTLTNGPQAFSLIVTGPTLAVLSNDMPDSFNNSFTVYPNPAKNLLYFSSDNNLAPDSILVFDATGKVIIDKVNVTGDNVDISALQTGIYYVKFTHGDSTIIKKFIKQ